MISGISSYPDRLAVSIGLLLLASLSYSQDGAEKVLEVGDRAPSLKMSQWIKGQPVRKFENGTVYVLEFWATWCKPCIAAMPHISELSRKYRGRVVFVGVDVYEGKSGKTNREIKFFVDSLGDKMSYNAAIEEKDMMVSSWLRGFGEEANGIPRTFVVDGTGNVVWIGHPAEGLDEVLEQITANTYDLNATIHFRRKNRHLAKLDDSLRFELMKYNDKVDLPHNLGKPDSALLVIDEIVKTEPGLKYAPFVGSNTFIFLLRTDPMKAYAFGKELLVTPSYVKPAIDVVIKAIEFHMDKLNFPDEIYMLGIEAYKMKINELGDQGVKNLAPKYYKNMSELFWRSRKETEAIEMLEKATNLLKEHSAGSAELLDEVNSNLRKYRARKTAIQD